MSETHFGQTRCFLCDQNLGRLARWLRILGFDAEFMRTWEENRVMVARRENRIILTRKHSLATSPEVILIRNDRVQDQLCELAAHFDLRAGHRPCIRCSMCNSLLEGVSRDEVRGLVPEYTYHTQKRFSRCPLCHRIYWKGSHCDRASDFVRSLFSAGTTP